MKWEKKLLGEVFEIARGGSPRPIDKYITTSSDGYNWIMIGDAPKGSKYITDIKKKISPEGLSRTRQVKPGDFLLTNSMSFGRPYILKTSGCIHDGWLVLSPRSDDVLPDYFYYLLGSETLKRQFIRGASGAVVKNLNTKMVKEVSVSVPPLAEQKRIAGILDAADALRAKRRESLDQLDALLQSTFLDMFGDPVANPKGWDTKTLPELILPGKHSLKRGPFGGALKKEIFVDSGYLVYEQNHALNNDYSFGRYFITEEKYKELIAFKVQPNDILISCSGVYLGKLSIVPIGAKLGIINQALLKVSLNQEKMETVFFTYVFGSVQFKKRHFPSNRGVAIPNLPPMNVMKKIAFIAPPLSLQRGFAAIVESVEQQKARLRAHLAELDALFASLQSRAFNGEL